MALNQHLELRQSQSMVMTPQLCQAIALLQLSGLDLAAYVEQELDRNPLLERLEPGAAADAGAPSGVDAESGPESPPGIVDSATSLSAGELAPAGEAPLDADFDNVWESAPFSPSGEGPSHGGALDGEGDDFDPLERLCRSETLRDHLLSQLALDIAEPAQRLIGTALIDALDDAGYLPADLGPLAEQLGCSLPEVEAVLGHLQAFEPVGVFARSLKECLALQLADRNRLDPCMQALLDHLNLLALHNVPALLRVCQVDALDLTDMIAEIRRLNPKPGAGFEPGITSTLIPDVLLTPTPATTGDVPLAGGGQRVSVGGWAVELNPEALPAILVNHRGYAAMTARSRNKDERDYLSEHFQAASWLVRSLQQRAGTLLKVATEIVRQQDAFFRLGVSALRPLVLRDIASTVGVHESTVSRVTTAKYIATPRGTFELKYFFSASIAGTSGTGAHSAESVRARVKALIDHESPERPLSDDRLTALLQAEGIDIARRTVAKYREALHLPTASQRRRARAAGF